MKVQGKTRSLGPAFALLTLLCNDPVVAGSEFDKGMDALLAGNYAEAYCIWKPLAGKGDAAAQYNLGWLYANGNGLNVSVETAVSWWRKAAAQGHTDAQFAVGMAYTTGEGIGKDPAEAMRWFIAAATRGLEDAREIIVLLGNDPAFDTLQEFPELLQYDWYGQQGAIKKDLVNVRQSPGTDSPILAKLNQGDRVRIVQQRNDWSRVVLPAISPDSKSVATGWIFSPLIRISN